MTQQYGFDEEQDQQRRLQQLKSCQTLTTVALIGAPVSLLIGGVALSIAALVCAIVAFVKVRKTSAAPAASGSIERTLQTLTAVALAVSCAATVLNGIAFIYMFGALIQALETGDMSGLLGTMGSMQMESAPQDKSIWD